MLRDYRNHIHPEILQACRPSRSPLRREIRVQFGQPPMVRAVDDVARRRRLNTSTSLRCPQMPRGALNRSQLHRDNAGCVTRPSTPRLSTAASTAGCVPPRPIESARIDGPFLRTNTNRPRRFGLPARSDETRRFPNNSEGCQGSLWHEFLARPQPIALFIGEFEAGMTPKSRSLKHPWEADSRSDNHDLGATMNCTGQSSSVRFG